MGLGRGLLVLALTAVAGAEEGRPLLVTVDDLPVAGGRLHGDAEERQRITGDLLAVLARHQVPALGFVVWGSVASEGDVAILERWLAAGHELGNHTASHRSYSAADAESYVADAEAGRAGLASFLDPRGQHVRFFRFPMLREGNTGAKLDAMRAYLQRTGQRNVPVTIDNPDYAFEERWVTARRAGDASSRVQIGEEYQLALRLEVLSQTALGDRLFGREVAQVLLLHANEVGTAQWDVLFAWLKDRGFRFASVEEVMADEAITAMHGHVASRGASLWHRINRERQEAEVREAITAVLAEQAAAWNRGDLETFCSVYADDALFVTPSGLTRGRAAVLERYHQRYPTKEAMGTLSLEPVELRQAWGYEPNLLDDNVPSRTWGVSVAARWALRRADGNESLGNTVIVFHRVDGRWLIVHDASM